jgi:hypothetical protein
LASGVAEGVIAALSNYDSMTASKSALIALADEEKHLRVPIVRRERPTMTEDNRLSAAPILIIDVDISSVFFSDSYVWHSWLVC